MKKTLSILVSCLLVNMAQAQTLNSTVATTSSSALPAATANVVVSRDANSTVWQRTTYEMAPDGTTTTNVHSYVELASGLNHLVNGQYVPSTENIVVSPDGSSAMATNGQHQVYFPGNIFSGQIKLVTPDGKVMQSEPIGLAYSDGSNSVLLAVITNSTGAILPSGNEVIYTNAFAGLKADLLYRNTKVGMEQNVVIRQAPPDPASLGLNSAKVRLQMISEFVSCPQPSVSAMTVPTAAGNLENDNLNFGSMRMGRGKAFLLGTKLPPVRVEKRWLRLNGRQFLIEEVPIVSIEQATDTLPPFVSQAGSKAIISKNLILPPQRLVHSSPTTRFLAQAFPPNQGFVLDYLTEDGVWGYGMWNWDFTFQRSSTYYVDGEFDINGTTTFEGGTVIKFDESASYENGGIVPNAGVNFQTGPYCPVIITSANDNSVGETISGSSGNPSRYNCSALDFDISPTLNGPVKYLYIRYAAVGFTLGAVAPVPVRDCQFVNVGTGVQAYDCGVVPLENDLFSGITGYAVDGNWGGSFVAANLTVHDANSLMSASTPLNVTNSLFICATNWGNTFTGAFNYTNSSDAGVFQTVGAGSHYLAANCPAGIQSAGTTNIDPVLLAELQTKTTYPPMLLTDQTASENTVLSPQAQRNTDIPDLGYHYDPIDYIADQYVITNATLTLTSGVAIATCNEPGIELQDGSFLTSVGSPQYPNWLVHYQSVQEGTNLLDGSNPGLGSTILPAYTSAMPSAQFQFTKFACPAASGPELYDCSAGAYSNLVVQECEFWGGANNFSGNTNTVTVLNNNLFAESFVTASLPIGTLNINDSLACTNNLFWNFTFTFYPRGNSNSWSFFNNAFDTVPMASRPPQNSVNGYNAYLVNPTRLYPTNAFDIVSSSGLAYQTGPFGSFYQPTNSPLIQKGSTNANLVGLYHYTVQTNVTWNALAGEYSEVPEGTNRVSIGYHYVAADANGNPLDTDGDGVPDYLEDANGNGLVDNGESSWTNYNSANGLTSGNGLVVFTPLR